MVVMVETGSREIARSHRFLIDSSSKSQYQVGQRQAYEIQIQERGDYKKGGTTRKDCVEINMQVMIESRLGEANLFPVKLTIPNEYKCLDTHLVRYTVIRQRCI